MDENINRGYIQLGHRSKLVLPRAARPPSDPCHCIYMALLLAGVGFFLPYNSFIIAVDYFQSRYPATTIVFDMSLVYILVALLAVIVNNALVETLSLDVRIGFGYVVAFFTLLFVAVFEIWFEVFDLGTGYYVNLLAVAVVSFGCTVQQSSFYGYTSMLPARYTQAVMTGESTAGLLVSVSRILTKALLKDEKLNTVLFFCVSLFIVLCCSAVHALLRRSYFVNFYVDLCSGTNDQDDMQKHIILEPTEDVGLVDMLDPSETKCGKYGVLSLRSPSSSPVLPPEGARIEDASEDTEAWRTSCESIVQPTKYRVQDVVVRMRGSSYPRQIQWWSGIKRGVSSRKEVSYLIWPYMLSIALAYLVTLTLYPGMESEIVSCTLGSWMPVLLMAAFNFSDCVGKVVASVSLNWTPQQLLMLSCSRILLIPLLALCAAPRGDPFLGGEGWALSLSLLLGLTNGIAGSVPMIVAPSVVPDEHKELTGNIMTLSYSMGLTTGSGVAYLIDYFLGPPLLHPCHDLWQNTTLNDTSSLVVGPEMWNITLPLNDTSVNGTSFF